MAFFHEENSSKAKFNFSPSLHPGYYYPSGSLNSPLDSLLTEDPVFKSIMDDFPTEDHAPYEIITYESICTSQVSHKESQTDSPESSHQLHQLQQSIIDLKQECKNYIKQNSELRTELKLSQQEKENDKLQSLKDEVKRLKSKIQVHESFVQKMITMTEEICGEFSETTKKERKIDFHSYSYLFSKLEIIRSRVSRFHSKINQLEAEKISITELLNFYISAAKMIQVKRPPDTNSGSLTPDLMNPLFTSRKSSNLMENSSNTIRSTPFEDQNDMKKPLSSGSEGFENKESVTYPNTEKNLKGISKLARPTHISKKSKGSSYSVSPLLPKPKKGIKISSSKENAKSNTIKIVKNIPDDGKKKRNRCKS